MLPLNHEVAVTPSPIAAALMALVETLPLLLLPEPPPGRFSHIDRSRHLGWLKRSQPMMGRIQVMGRVWTHLAWSHCCSQDGAFNGASITTAKASNLTTVWECNACYDATFEMYEDACHHEMQCRAHCGSGNSKEDCCKQEGSSFCSGDYHSVKGGKRRKE